MNARILIASIMVLISFIIHIYSGNKKTSFFGRCTWQCLSVDLLLNIVGLIAMIYFGDFENKALYLQYWSMYNLIYILCFFVKTIQAKQKIERYSLIIQTVLYFGISGLLCV
jgi:hypothetical protein